jgi:hypothetical protein
MRPSPQRAAHAAPHSALCRYTASRTSGWAARGMAHHPPAQVGGRVRFVAAPAPTMGRSRGTPKLYAGRPTSNSKLHVGSRCNTRLPLNIGRCGLGGQRECFGPRNLATITFTPAGTPRHGAASTPVTRGSSRGSRRGHIDELRAAYELPSPAACMYAKLPHMASADGGELGHMSRYVWYLRVVQCRWTSRTGHAHAHTHVRASWTGVGRSRSKASTAWRV